MEVSSELPLAAESVPPVLFTEGMGGGNEALVVEDEEFPADLPVNYDWLLQPASRRARQKFGVVILVGATLLIAVSLLVAHNLSQSFPRVLASPPSSSK